MKKVSAFLLCLVAIGSLVVSCSKTSVEQQAPPATQTQTTTTTPTESTTAPTDTSMGH